jgi:hypothetical protein
MPKYRITWKRTHKTSGTTDWPLFVQVFDDPVKEIDQIPSRFRARYGFGAEEIEVVQVERLDQQ